MTELLWDVTNGFGVDVLKFDHTTVDFIVDWQSNRFKYNQMACLLDLMHPTNVSIFLVACDNFRL